MCCCQEMPSRKIFCLAEDNIYFDIFSAHTQWTSWKQRTIVSASPQLSSWFCILELCIATGDRKHSITIPCLMLLSCEFSPAEVIRQPAFRCGLQLLTIRPCNILPYLPKNYRHSLILLDFWLPTKACEERAHQLKRRSRFFLEASLRFSPRHNGLTFVFWLDGASLHHLTLSSQLEQV